MRKTILAVSGLVFGITACSSYDNSNTIPTERTPVASIAVTLPSQSLLPGQTQRASAAARDASGATLSGRSIVWQSSAPAVAAVDDAGIIAAVAPGATTISASSEGVTGQGALTVMAPSPIPVATVSVSPAASTLQIGGTVQLSAVTRDAGGNVLTGRAVVWSSSNANIASVSSGGVVTAVSAGNATFSASSEGQVGTATAVVSAPAPVPVATVSVSPATTNLQIGGTVQLSAVTRDAGGATLTGRAIAWTTANAAVATISSNGLVTAVSAGTTTLSATSEGRVGTATVTAASAVVASITVSLPASTLAIGQTTQASATLRDANNNVITGRTVTWSSGNNAVLTVSASGLVTAVAQGTTTVIATNGTVSGNASATVTPPVSQGPAPEPGGSDVIVFQDNYDRSTVAALVQGYATRGDMLPVVDGHSGSAIRFPYTGASYDNLIEKNLGGAYQDIYFRFWWRTSPGADPTCQDRGGSGMKWFMPWRATTNIRYTMGVGNLSNGPTGRNNIGTEFSSHDNTSSDQPNPFLSNINNSIRFNTTNDGQWHRYTLHVVTSLGDGTGYEQIWVDGTLLLDNSSFHYHHDPNGIAMVQFPGTLVNWFSGCDFTIDIDDFVAWHK